MTLIPERQVAAASSGVWVANQNQQHPNEQRTPRNSEVHAPTLQLQFSIFQASLDYILLLLLASVN